MELALGHRCPKPHSLKRAAPAALTGCLQIERVARKVYRTRDQARADVFDYIERFYNPRRRH